MKITQTHVSWLNFVRCATYVKLIRPFYRLFGHKLRHFVLVYFSYLYDVSTYSFAHSSTCSFIAVNQSAAAAAAQAKQQQLQQQQQQTLLQQSLQQGTVSG